jgi:rhomboid protease GluP
MLNEPPREKRSVHPLERKPEPPSPEQLEQQRQQRVSLRIPYVQPVITFVLIIINIVIFAAGEFSPQLNETLLLNGVNNQTAVLLDREYQRLLFSMFLHASLVHVIANMYSLYIVGAAVERMFGHARFFIIYLLGGLTGSVLSVVFNGPDTFSVGASGAVFAIFGANIVFIYVHRRLLGARGRAQLRTMLIFAALNFGVGVLSAVTPGGINIDNWAHLGGFLGGIILAWFLGPQLILRAHPDHPGEFQAEDVNPLARRATILPLYIAGLLVLLILATLMVQQ